MGEEPVWLVSLRELEKLDQPHEPEEPDKPDRPEGILTAAALIYVAAPLASLLNLWRWIAFLARIIHGSFYYNRRYVATTSLTAGGLAAHSVNILCQVCLPHSRLRAPVSLDVSTVSSRTLVNNAG
jgi:hypothetical protein